MATAAAQDGFRPVHEAHAIEHLLVTIHFDRPLADEGVRAANVAMAQFQRELPGRNEIRGVGFQIGPNGVQPLLPAGTPNMPDGITRFFTDGRGVLVKELRVDRQSLVYRTQVYTRWDEVWAEARGYIHALLPRLGEVNLAAYSLGYVDKFVWHGNSGDARPSHLLRAGSPYVAPKSFDASDLWHCHTGQFEAVSAHTKRLVAVNLDCADEPSETGQAQRVVRISTTVTDVYNQPGYAAFLIGLDAALPLLDSRFADLHEVQKAVFVATVNERAAAQVGINNAT